MMSLPAFEQADGITAVPVEFDAYQSFFLVFPDRGAGVAEKGLDPVPDADWDIHAELEGPWTLSFDPAWSGPGEVEFGALVDWTIRPEEGIRYYSGIVPYKTVFQVENRKERLGSERMYLDLGVVHDLARVILNGKDLGVVWTAPWHVDITDALKEGDNQLEIQVANRWPNRLIGDEFLPYDGVKDGQLPSWLTGDTPRTSGRVTFTTFNCYTSTSPLLPSGLLGPVTLKTRSK
jgi:hypothetical protein